MQEILNDNSNRKGNISKLSVDNTSTIKEQIVKHLGEFSEEKPEIHIVSKSAKGMTVSKRKEEILKQYKKFGCKIDVENFGIIQIGEKEIGSSLSYLNKDAEYAAFFAIPYVLKRGRIIDGHLNRKNKGFKTAKFAAPVTINGEPGMLAVVVKLTRGYRYKTHRILAPDSTEFKFVQKKEEATNFGVTTSDSSQGPNITSYKRSLYSNEIDVKKESDEAYSEAVSVKNMSKVKQMVAKVADTAMPDSLLLRITTANIMLMS